MISRAGRERSHRFRMSRLFSASIVPAASLMSVPQHPGGIGFDGDADPVTRGEPRALQRFVLFAQGKYGLVVGQAHVVMGVGAEIDDIFQCTAHLADTELV